jgi:hypothetical protein
MIDTHDSIVISVPRKIAADVSRMSDDLAVRMHDLLERNTDGALSATERAELETLVRIAEFGQLVSLAIEATGRP